MTAETVARPFELPPHVAVVEHLAVEGDGVPPGRGAHRLVAVLGQIEDDRVVVKSGSVHLRTPLPCERWCPSCGAWRQVA